MSADHLARSIRTMSELKAILLLVWDAWVRDFVKHDPS